MTDDEMRKWLAEWKLANPNGTREECRRALRESLTGDDIEELVEWNRERGLITPDGKVLRSQ